MDKNFYSFKQKAKLFISVIVCFFASISLVHADVKSPQTKRDTIQGTCGDNISYSLDTSSGKMVINGLGKMHDCVKSNSPWHDVRAQIKSVEVKDGVDYTGKNCFNDCYNLETVTIAGSVQAIGEAAFCGCVNLKTLKLSDGLLSIGPFAFAGCLKLEDIDLPETVSYIGNSAFADCYKLKRLDIPYGTQNIEPFTFRNDCNLRSVTASDTVNKLETRAFQNSGLQEIKVASGVTVESGAFNDCSLDKLKVNLTSPDFVCAAMDAGADPIVLTSNIPREYASLLSYDPDLNDINYTGETVSSEDQTVASGSDDTVSSGDQTVVSVSDSSVSSGDQTVALDPDNTVSSSEDTVAATSSVDQTVASSPDSSVSSEDQTVALGSDDTVSSVEDTVAATSSIDYDDADSIVSASTAKGKSINTGDQSTIFILLTGALFSIISLLGIKSRQKKR